MRLPDGEEERPIAWRAILEHTPVLSADGNETGTISEVVGSDQEDIFHGIVVRLGMLGREVLVPADRVTTITNRRIEVALGDEALRELEEYRPDESYHLGMVGHFRKHLGWIREDSDPHS